MRRLYLTYNQNVSERFDVRFSPGSERRWSWQDRKMVPFVKHGYLKWKGALGGSLYLGLSGTPTWGISESYWGLDNIRKQTTARNSTDLCRRVPLTHWYWRSMQISIYAPADQNRLTAKGFAGIQRGGRRLGVEPFSRINRERIPATMMKRSQAHRSSLHCQWAIIAPSVNSIW